MSVSRFTISVRDKTQQVQTLTYVYAAFLAEFEISKLPGCCIVLMSQCSIYVCICMCSAYSHGDIELAHWCCDSAL